MLSVFLGLDLLIVCSHRGDFHVVRLFDMDFKMRIMKTLEGTSKCIASMESYK